MFGFPMYVQGFNRAGQPLGVLLRPLARSEIEGMINHFSSGVVHKYTLRRSAVTLEGEEKWYQHADESETNCMWAISAHLGISAYSSSMYEIPPIGITGIDKIDIPHGSCSSGVIIWDQNWWGNGVASLAHIARTWYAAEVLNRLTILSQVCSSNLASLSALEGVGYINGGKYIRAHNAYGEWIDRFCLTWVNPRKLEQLFKGSIPTDYNLAISLAEVTLQKAKQIVSMV